MTAYDIAGAITYSLAFGGCLGLSAVWSRPIRILRDGPTYEPDSLFVLPLMVSVPFLFGAVFSIARLCGASV